MMKHVTEELEASVGSGKIEVISNKSIIKKGVDP